jgi:pyruvate dehydrogenase E2 component (dihydrolipoamide acetyltransferase)
LPLPAGGGVVEVKVPDIGDFADVPVIELFVKVGDSIKVDDAIATLESDKATMDVPSTVAGTVKEVLVQLGSKVGEGVVLIKVETGAAAPAAAPQAAARRLPLHPSRFLPRLRRPQQHRRRWPRPCRRQQGHASPSVRAYARELGVDLSKVAATGPKNRIVKEDLTKYVKGVMSGPFPARSLLPQAVSSAVACSICCPGRRSISPSSARSRSSRCRASRRFPARTCRATG